MQFPNKNGFREHAFKSSQVDQLFLTHFILYRQKIFNFISSEPAFAQQNRCQSMDQFNIIDANLIAIPYRLYHEGAMYVT